MSEMKNFRESLNGWFVGNDQTERPPLLEDFPELLEKDGPADSIYNQIREAVDLGTGLRESGVVVIVEDETAIFTSGFVEVRLNLFSLLAVLLSLSYNAYKPKDENYDRRVVLEEAIALVVKTLNYLTKYCASIPVRAFQESFNLTVATSGEFPGSVEEVRKWMERKFKVKIKPGPKPARRDDPGLQDPEWLFHEVMDYLSPDFDGKNKDKKMKVCEKVVELYTEELNLQDPLTEGRELVLKLYEHRKSNRAAVFLIAKILSKTERHISRCLTGR